MTSFDAVANKAKKTKIFCLTSPARVGEIARVEYPGFPVFFVCVKKINK